MNTLSQSSRIVKECHHLINACLLKLLQYLKYATYFNKYCVSQKKYHIVFPVNLGICFYYLYALTA